VSAAPRRRLGVAIALATVFTSPGTAAYGQRALPVALLVQGCGPRHDEIRLRRLVAIEVGTVGADAPPRPTTVRLTCGGEQLQIEVRDDQAGGASRSELSLVGVAEATRLRLIALTITELVAMTWREPRPTPARAPAPAPPAAVTTAPLPARGPPRVRLFATTSLRRMGGPGTWLTGLGAGGEYAARDWLALTLDLRVETGDTATAVAAVGWRTLVGTAAIAFGAARGRWSWNAAPGFSGGAVRLSAVATAPNHQGETYDGAWAGPTLAVRARYTLGRSGFLQAEAAAGFVTHRVVGLLNGSSPLVQIAGPWSLAGAGAGFRFW
jgi:hypothetical protein